MFKYFFIFATLSLLFAASTASALEVYRTDSANLELNGRLQLLGVGERLDDGVRDDNRLYLYARQARLAAKGQVADLTLRLEMAFGGEEVVRAPSPGVSLGLLEASADLGIVGNLRGRFGQFRAPFGRERLSNPGTLLFADRSVTNAMFNVGRDVGGAVYGDFGGVVAIVGVFTGGGRAVPERYLPQTLGTPMVIARLGYNLGLDSDPFDLRQQAAPADKLAAAFYVNALYQTDSLIGHSSIFNVKGSDKPLLLNGNWNPHVGTRPSGADAVDRGTLTQLSVDAAVRTPLAGHTLSAEAEFHYGTFDNVLGSVTAMGARAQAGLLMGRLEVAARYATLLATDDFEVGSSKMLTSDPVHEITPALSWHFGGANAKVILDLPVTLNAPTVREARVGTYSLLAMPDQASLLKPGAPAKAGDPPTDPKGTLERQTVITGRLMAQFAF